MTEGSDREIEGAARIYERAQKWGHLPSTMTFEIFLAVLRRGDDPYLGNHNPRIGRDDGYPFAAGVGSGLRREGGRVMSGGTDRLTLEQIATELGDQIVWMLVGGFGGTRLYIPLEPDDSGPLVRVLGREAAHKLGHRFGGETVDVPLHKTRAERCRQRTAILKLREAGHSVAAIARYVGCSERHIYYVLSQQARTDAAPEHA
jgi:Mor family transcriptional regulator